MNSIYLLLFFVLVYGQRNQFIFRPNLYFGTRSKLDVSHMSGLMWMQGIDFNKIRHQCKDEDHLSKLGWMEYNGDNYGYQTLVDKENRVSLRTSFVLENDTNWVLRVSGKSLSGTSRKTNLTLIYYIVTDGDDSYIKTPILSNQKDDHKSNSFSVAYGSHDQGDMLFYVNKKDSINEPLEVLTSNTHLNINYKKMNKVPLCYECQQFHYYGTKIKDSNDYWKASEFIKQKLYNSAQSTYTMVQETKEKLRPFAQDINYDNISPVFAPILPILPDSIDKNSNMIAIQTIVQAPFTIEYVFMKNTNQYNSFSSLFSKKDQFSILNEDMNSFINNNTNEALTNKLKSLSNSYTNQFESIFHLKEKSFNTKEIKVASYMLSNLLGGLGFFTGNTILKDEMNIQHYTNYGHLLTQVPSRSFFPRGFLWDEGFHLLLTCRWNQTLCIDILESWFDRIYENGYIEREQILGDESRSKVPEQFIPQSMEIANPPTLLFSIEYLYSLLKKDTQSTVYDNHIDIDYNNELISSINLRLSNLLPSIYKWYHWFNTTQSIASSSFSDTTDTTGTTITNTHDKSSILRYRWKSRTSTHCLSSGIDDFPRHPYVTDTEGQIDLLVWVHYMTVSVEHLLTLQKEHTNYNNNNNNNETLSIQYDIQQLQEFSKKLENEMDTYWNQNIKMYSDIGAIKYNNQSNTYITGFSNHKGYVSLFPFLFGLVSSSSPKLKYILDDLTNPDILWSKYGIRSLSKSSEYYGKDENYWRGSVWININYLVLRILHNKYMIEEGYQQERCKQIYTDLRMNLIHNVINQYEKTGFVWESYKENGEGKGVHPFTGWTTLIVLIMAEYY